MIKYDLTKQLFAGQHQLVPSLALQVIMECGCRRSLREHAMMTTNSLKRRSRQCLVLKQVAMKHEWPLTLD